MVLCGEVEEEETAFIDQCAVAACKKLQFRGVLYL